ncbi:exodeoxyribonuclease VII large subunit [gut metagenome]|uniref:Exodeoxyribonuclease VII large subunit n=1 Tax=gut metagenome TaxID=749906 RepID=J9G9N2_9ZZZZ
MVVIIRGGGAVTDLNGFDSYLLAANVAQFPLPVLTGIGHERDDTIVDLVAHLRLKTPTAVAAFLIDRRGQEMAQVDDLRRRLVEAVRQRLHTEEQRQERVASHLTLAVSQQLAMQRRMYQLLAHRYAIASTQFFSRQREQLTRQSVALQSAVWLDLQLRYQQMEALLPRISLALERYFQRKHDQHTLIERSLRLAGPNRILAMGFSITLTNGKPIRSAASLRPGDILETRLAEGSVQSVVQESFKPQNE